MVRSCQAFQSFHTCFRDSLTLKADAVLLQNAVQDFLTTQLETTPLYMVHRHHVHGAHAKGACAQSHGT